MVPQTLLVAALLVTSASSSCTRPISVLAKSPENAETPWPDFVSFSIESSSFPDFAGMTPINKMCIRF